jgi:hypothetical protein
MSYRGAHEIIPEPIMKLMERESSGKPMSAQDQKSLDDFIDGLSAEDLLDLEAEENFYQEVSDVED